jgi:RNA polymerase sigma-70 factor (ECF subfamily)
MRDVIERARAGDRDALGALFRSHQHLLLRYFRGLGASSPADLASQVWIDVAAGLGRFSGDEIGFRRWLFTIARRRHIDALRRDVRTSARDAAATSGEVDHSVEDAFDARDSLARAIALLGSLPPDMAEAILLRVVADLDVTAVAGIMGTSEGNVRVLVHRGLGRLRSCMVVTSESPATINR